MLKEFQQIDGIFKGIKTITLLLVMVYMVWCYCLIRKICQPADDNKSGYSVTASQGNIPTETVIAIRPIR